MKGDRKTTSLLKTFKIVTGKIFRSKLVVLERNIRKNLTEWEDKHNKLILHHDNAKPCNGSVIKTSSKAVL